MRLLLGIAVYYAYGKIQTFPVEQYQIGIGRVLDLGFFHQPTVRQVSHITVGLCMAIYVWGRFAWLTMPIVAFLFIGAGTLNTSQGSTQHHLQVGAVLLLTLALWHLGSALWTRFKDSGHDLQKVHRLAPFFAIQVLVASYLLAGIAKLDESGLAWISDARHAPVALRKTSDQYYFSVTDQAPPKAIGVMERVPHLVQELFVAKPWIASLFMGPGLLLELAAVFALVGRRSALVIGAILVGFHYMVSEVMNLHFELNNHLIAIYLLNVPFWLWAVFNRRKKQLES